MSKLNPKQLNIFDFLNKKTLRIATMCSGIGTPEIALKELGFEIDIIFACEIEKFARQTYIKNHKIDKKYFHTDIAAFNASSYMNKIDLLIFGSPCQPFSIAGLRKGFEDDRGKVFFDGINRIEECKPEIVIFENVKGLVNHDDGKTFQIVKDEFQRIGYAIKYKIFNSFNHGSVQQRERIFLIAFKDEKKALDFDIKDFEIITNELYIEDYLLPIEEVDSKYYLSKTARLFMEQDIKDGKRLSEGLYLKSRFEHSNINYSNNKKAYTITANYSKGCPHNILIDERGCKNGFWTCDFAFCDDICESCNYDSGSSNYQLNDIPTPAYRRMTPRECARIQGIPDSFIFPVSDSQAYKQIGNSMEIYTLKSIFSSLLL
ncbi:DNA cytosine methyltransferase [Aliarcobacter butzleri]|uniref:DNA cytosine methyltransferase n=1 Tax=Aliarcobacter butzleri TaxID=28197 RepID=UPI001269CAF2|nr:DNA (cytosine-5-)-methyltransferase [Aliarcobacter butzleri]